MKTKLLSQIFNSTQTSSCHKPMTQSIFLPSAYQTELKGETDFPMHFLYKGVSRHINYQKRFPKMFRGGAIRFISVCKRLECATGMCESIKTIHNDTSQVTFYPCQLYTQRTKLQIPKFRLNNILLGRALVRVNRGLSHWSLLFFYHF